MEAVNGVVVGVAKRGVGPPRHGAHVLSYFVVAISAHPDSGAAPLERALRTLGGLPHVQDVQPYFSEKN